MISATARQVDPSLIAPEGRRLPLASLALCGALLLGVFVPTSSDGIYRPVVNVVGALIAVLGLIYLRLAMPPPNPAQVLGAAAFFLGIVFGTATSPFRGDYTPGLAPTLLGVGLLVTSAPFHVSQAATRRILVAFRATGVVVAIWVVALLIPVQRFQSPTIQYFPAYYQSLLQYMVEEVRHPVTSWALHSVAAYFYFLLLIFFREDFLANGRKLSLWMIFFWIFALASLRNFTGIALAALGIIFVAGSFLETRRRAATRHRALSIAVIVAFAGAVVVALKGDEIARLAGEVIGIDVSGFSGRYSEDSGSMYETIRWLQRRPFTPIGLTESERIFVGDSGYIDYFLRGGFLSVIGVYVAFAATVYRFIRGTYLRIFLIGSLMLVDFGFGALNVWRLQLVFVPLLIALRSVETQGLTPLVPRGER